MKPLYFKQWGVQRSGTNAVKALIELNWPDYPVFVSVFGGKHREYQNPINWWCNNLVEEKDDMCVFRECNKRVEFPAGYLQLIKHWPQVNVISVRNPWAWLPSWAKKCKDQELTDEWIEEQCELYGSRYENWLNEAVPNVVVAQEELAVCPAKIVKRIAEAAGLDIPEQMRWPLTRMAMGNDITGTQYSNTKFDAENLYHKKYLEKFAVEQIGRIRELCSPTLSHIQEKIDGGVFGNYYLER